MGEFEEVYHKDVKNRRRECINVRPSVSEIFLEATKQLKGVEISEDEIRDFSLKHYNIDVIKQMNELEVNTEVPKQKMSKPASNSQPSTKRKAAVIKSVKTPKVVRSISKLTIPSAKNARPKGTVHFELEDPIKTNASGRRKRPLEQADEKCTKKKIRADVKKPKTIKKVPSISKTCSARKVTLPKKRENDTEDVRTAKKKIRSEIKEPKIIKRTKSITKTCSNVRKKTPGRKGVNDSEKNDIVKKKIRSVIKEPKKMIKTKALTKTCSKIQKETPVKKRVNDIQVGKTTKKRIGSEKVSNSINTTKSVIKTRSNVQKKTLQKGRELSVSKPLIRIRRSSAFEPLKTNSKLSTTKIKTHVRDLVMKDLKSRQRLEKRSCGTKTKRSSKTASVKSVKLSDVSCTSTPCISPSKHPVENITGKIYDLRHDQDSVKDDTMKSTQNILPNGGDPHQSTTNPICSAFDNNMPSELNSRAVEIEATNMNKEKEIKEAVKVDSKLKQAGYMVKNFIESVGKQCASRLMYFNKRSSKPTGENEICTLEQHNVESSKDSTIIDSGIEKGSSSHTNHQESDQESFLEKISAADIKQEEGSSKTKPLEREDVTLSDETKSEPTESAQSISSVKPPSFAKVTKRKIEPKIQKITATKRTKVAVSKTRNKVVNGKNKRTDSRKNVKVKSTKKPTKLQTRNTKAKR